jgi:glutamyl-tRNA(Gln) amidotransferase subunit E
MEIELAMLKPMEEMTPENYVELGLKSGLEIHQQLTTKKKLFCRCPAGHYSEKYDAEILRHMRPTLSELGEYDGTALMEFKTKKEIVYQLNKDTVCTYEMDDAPPFELNQEALDIALEITLLLNCNMVSELHIARKQYLDGSIPTGFQRTTILGIDGWIPYQDRKIGIIQLGLEEDACREVSDEGHIRTYRTDRLSMPLIEVVTYPHMHTPQEVADVAQLIRQLTRSTGKVNRGIGAARQDVNVSIEGGTRVEIKGVPRIPLIPILVHNEAGRQKTLLEIRDRLKQRGLTTENFKSEFFDVTDILKDTSYLPIKNVVSNDFKIKCVKLPFFKGILRYPTQPGTNFAKEISDRVRVIGCLDKIPNIIHSDTDDETISSTNWMKIKKLSRFEPVDALVIVWGNPRDVETASQEIVIRAQEAIIGVPSETRQALPDGTTGFERILPGPDRMYPDTDLPPFALSEDRIQRIQANLPPVPWVRREKYHQLGLPDFMMDQLLLSGKADIFDRLIAELKVDPNLAAVFLTQTLKHFKRKGLPVGKLGDDSIISVFKAYKNNQIVREAIPVIIENWLNLNARPIEDVITQYPIINERELLSKITEVIDENDLNTYHDEATKLSYVIGKVMKMIKGRVDGKIVAELTTKHIRK